MSTKAELGYEELRRRLAGEAKHIESLESLLVEATRERDEARSALAACATALGGVLDYDHLVEETRRLASERDEVRQNER